MRPDPAQLLTSLAGCAELAGKRRFVVAFSGGLDSTVLVDLARRALPRVAGASLLALHIDHGWHPGSGAWARRCLETAGDLGVRCELHTIDAAAAPGESPEAAARVARYSALAAALGQGDVLLTAHHADDQLETVLLQLARGAGPAGLAAMPALAPFARGWHWRPLLQQTRLELEYYAERAGLRAIADPANLDQRYDRSFLRAQVVPLLRERWPGIARAVGRSARHSAEAAALLDEMAARDLLNARAGAAHLDARRVGCLAPARQANLLRHWIALLGLPTPTAAQLQRACKDLLGSRYDAEPCVRWPGVELRRYRNLLYALPALEDVPRDWDAAFAPGQALQLPAGLGVLTSVPARGAGIALARLSDSMRVGFRAGGEALRPVGSAHTRALRKLYQEQGVVPWMRSRIPLLRVGTTLVAVGNLWVASAFAAAPGEPGAEIHWRGHPPLY